MTNFSNLPYIGCVDLFPNAFKKIAYVFEVWRKTISKYNYQEYLTPVIEYADLYEKKSGEDISKELFRLTDNKGRKLALRPDMTPSVMRLVSRIYNSEPKPLRLFSIANFFRGEKPQKGRLREFWQLNVDIFGSESIYTDLEIITSVIDLMEAFGASQEFYIIKVNHRKLIDFLLTDILKINDHELKVILVRKFDKFDKLSEGTFINELLNLGLNVNQINLVLEWFTSDLETLTNRYPAITKQNSFKDILFIIDAIKSMGYNNIMYSSSLIRGFDYYDGLIFELFDTSTQLKRSIFGGGRYDCLSNLFVNYKIPAIGYAVGSPITIFLDNWKLWPDLDTENKYFFPLLDTNYVVETLSLARALRSSLGVIIEVSNDVFPSITKALHYANSKKFDYVIIYGSDEIRKRQYIIKNMKDGSQKEYSI